MSFGGTNFGAAKTTAAATPTPATGFGFGTSTPASTTAPKVGFNFGPTPGQTATTAASTGFSFSAPATTITTGFSLGGTPAASTSSGLTLGQTSSTGFGLGATPATTSTTGFTLGGATTTQASAGFGFGGTASTQAPTGFGFGGTATSTAASTGFGFNTTGVGTGLLGAKHLGATSTAAGSTGIFGLGGATASTAGGSIFGQTVAKTTAGGLGGVDPKTTTSAATTDASKAGDGKTVKETQVENNVLLDVDEFRKFVKEENGETEQMKRMSSTPMMKVQEDNTALRQFLSMVSSGLQRNTCAVDQLKREMIQELKNAEMAIRTKETPAGLQYENTAPSEYFQSKIESFETQMLQYRQQIEMLENHLASLHQPNRITPEDLVLLLRKLHEAFIAMAARLHQIHEAVKTQKEHYLNYRKVFHGDSRNIFERQKKAPVKVSSVTHTDMYGQPPFPGINNAAAVAMASALTRSQQPQQQQPAPPVSGLPSFQPSTGFGTTGTTGFGGLGGTGTQTAGFKGFGTGTGSTGGLFGNTSNLTTTQSGSLFSSPLPASSGLPQPNLTAGTDQSFQLGKPPLGTKRGKR